MIYGYQNFGLNQGGLKSLKRPRRHDDPNHFAQCLAMIGNIILIVALVVVITWVVLSAFTLAECSESNNKALQGKILLGVRWNDNAPSERL